MRLVLAFFIAGFSLSGVFSPSAESNEDLPGIRQPQSAPVLLAQSRSDDDDIFGDNRRPNTSYRSERQRTTTTTPDTSAQDRSRIEEERARRAVESRQPTTRTTTSQPSTGRTTERSSDRRTDGRTDGRTRRESGAPQPPGTGSLEVIGPSADAPAPPSPPGTQPGAAKTATTLSERAILYLSPSSSIVSVGQRLVLTLNLENPKEVRFDKLGVTLAYDPRILAVVPPEDEEGELAIKNAASGLIQPNVEYSLIVNQIQPNQGLAFYHVHMMDSDVRRFKGSLGQIQFEALAPSSGTTIRFVNRDSNVKIEQLESFNLPWTYLEAKGEDVLGQPKIEGDGVLSATVRVNPSGDALSPYASMQIARERERERIPQGSVGLSIVPPMLSVRQGEPFSVRVRLENPSRVSYDYVCLLIQFDSRFVRILDADQDNWIRTGVNILDGPFRSAFPFDLSRANRVLQTRQGTFIDYRHGSYRTPLNSEGDFVEIHAVALKPTPLTRFAFRFQRPGLEPTTGVFRKGQDLLGEPDVPADGTEGLRLQILPTQWVSRASSR